MARCADLQARVSQVSVSALLHGKDGTNTQFDMNRVKSALIVDNVRSGAYGRPVPDMDHLPRHLRREWRRVAGEIGQHCDPVTQADLVERVVARSLRRQPLTCLPQLAAALDDAWRTGSSAPVEAEIVRLGPSVGAGVEQCFIDAARVLAAQGVLPLGEVPEALSTLADAGVRRIPEKMCFSYLEPSLADGAFPSRQDYRRYLAQVESEVRSKGMAAALVRHPDGSSVRAPRRRTQARSTAELMDQPVASL